MERWEWVIAGGAQPSPLLVKFESRIKSIFFTPTLDTQTQTLSIAVELPDASLSIALPSPHPQFCD